MVDVSFKALQDKSERDYLNQLPTSFVLPNEAVDWLRAAARTLILNSPDLHQALKAEWQPIGEQPVVGITATVTTPPAAIEAK